MAAALLGLGACPLCGGQARVTLSKRDLPVMTCSHCGIQLFARSDRSDELMRDRISAAPEPVVVHEQLDDSTEPRTAPEGFKVPDAVKVIAPPAVPKKQAEGMGLLKSWF